jgi:hypothetical protein
LRKDLQGHLHGAAPSPPVAPEGQRQGQGQTAVELAEGSAPVSHSLLHHIKAAREAAARTCDALHDRLSTQLQRGLDRDEGGRGRRLHSSCPADQLGGPQCHAAASVHSVAAHIAEEQVVVDVAAGTAQCQAVDVPMQSDGAEGEEEEGVAVLRDCLVVASADSDCLLLTLRSLADIGAEGEEAEAYCYRCSLQSLLDCACRSVEAEGDASAGSGVRPLSAADVHAVHACVYSKPSTSGDPCAVSILLSVELSSSRGKDAACGLESFLLCLALEELRYTRVLIAGSGGSGQQSEYAPEEARLVRSAVPQQPLPDGAVRCRKVAMRGVRLLAARGERGVALLSDGAGKTIVLDIEANDDDDDDDDDDEEDGEEGDDNSEGGGDEAHVST